MAPREEEKLAKAAGQVEMIVVDELLSGWFARRPLARHQW